MLDSVLREIFTDAGVVACAIVVVLVIQYASWTYLARPILDYFDKRGQSDDS